MSAFHQFWKLKYRGQSLLFDAGSSLAFFEAIKTGMEWAFLSLHYKSWHHDTYNDMPAVSPRNMTVKFTHKDCIFLRLSLPPLRTSAPNTRAGRTRAGKAVGISSEIFLVIKGVLRLNYQVSKTFLLHLFILSPRLWFPTSSSSLPPGLLVSIFMRSRLFLLDHL